MIKESKEGHPPSPETNPALFGGVEEGEKAVWLRRDVRPYLGGRMNPAKQDHKQKGTTALAVGLHL